IPRNGARTPRARPGHSRRLRRVQPARLRRRRPAVEDEAAHRRRGGARHAMPLLHQGAYQSGLAAWRDAAGTDGSDLGGGGDARGRRFCPCGALHRDNEGGRGEEDGADDARLRLRRVAQHGARRMRRKPDIAIKRVYEKPEESDGFRVLVDRLWPRGLKKEAAALDAWHRELAPSDALRRWFGHDVARWPEFRRRYVAELRDKGEAL